MLNYFILIIFFVLIDIQTVLAYDFTWGYDSYLLGTKSKVADSLINPNNLVLKLPQTKVTLEQRLDFKIQADNSKFIFRPQWLLGQSFLETQSNKNEFASINEVQINDLFLESQLSSQFYSTLGLQVYQWGSGELLNPTNPFFHFNSSQRTLNYKEKGHVLGRLNYTTAKDWSFIFIVEPISNLENHWIAEKKFKEQALIKIEKSGQTGRHFLGLVVGLSDDADYFYGEYGQWEFIEGWTAFFDIKQSVNKFSYRPEKQGVLFNMKDEELPQSVLGLLGLRYEGDFDFRVEYIYNSVGYNAEEFDQALISAGQVLSPQFLLNVNRFNLSGLELKTKNYLYLSARKTDFLKIKESQFFLRSLTSLLDNSGVEQFELEKNLNDHWSFLAQFSVFRGAQDTEFKLLNDYQLVGGFKIFY